MKILFVCTANVNRSPACAREFERLFPEHEVRSAGTLYGYPYQLDEDVLGWAERVYVMDLSHEQFIFERWPEHLSKVKVIGISDQYDVDSEELADLIAYWLRRHYLAEDWAKQRSAPRAP